MCQEFLDDDKDLVEHLLFEDAVLNDFEELEEITFPQEFFTDEEVEKIPDAKYFGNCPECNSQSDSEPFLTKVFQMDLLDGFDPWTGSTYQDWIEVHRCWNCKTLFKFENSSG
jgi:hypothetical protein